LAQLVHMLSIPIQEYEYSTFHPIWWQPVLFVVFLWYSLYSTVDVFCIITGIIYTVEWHCGARTSKHEVAVRMLLHNNLGRVFMPLRLLSPSSTIWHWNNSKRFLGQQPKIKRNFFKRKNGIHSIQRDEVPEIIFIGFKLIGSMLYGQVRWTVCAVKIFFFLQRWLNTPPPYRNCPVCLSR